MLGIWRKAIGEDSLWDCNEDRKKKENVMNKKAQGKAMKYGFEFKFECIR